MATPLVGSQVVVSSGNLHPSVVSLIGSDVSVESGFLGVVKALTGSSVTSSSGTLDYFFKHDLVGSQVSVLTGTLLREFDVAISEDVSIDESVTNEWCRSITETLTSLDYLGLPGVIADILTVTDSSSAPIIWKIAESLGIDDSTVTEVATKVVESISTIASALSKVRFRSTSSDELNIYEIFTAAFNALCEENTSITDSTVPLPRKYKALTELLSLLTSSSGNVGYYNTILITVGIADAVKRSFDATTSDDTSIDDTLVTLLKADGSISEDTSITDSASRYVRLYAVSTEDELTITTTISPNQTLNALSSDTITLGLSFDDGSTTYTGWVVNPENYAVSNYDGWDFNSLAYLNKEYYGANSSGLFLINGNMDGASYIEARITTAAMDFDISNDKQMPAVYLGLTQNSELVLKVSVDGKYDVYYQLDYDTENLETQTIAIGKGLHGRYWQFELITVDTTEFDLDTMEFYPVIWGRKR